MRSLLTITFLLVLLTASAQPAGKLLKTDAARDLIPEGLAIKDTTIYISSIHRHLIMAIDKYGKSKNFIHPNQDGYAEGLGMHIDPKQNWLWALSNLKVNNTFTSHIHAFDLANGTTKQHYQLQDTVPHLFNDLAIDTNGLLYITDTYASAVYRYNPATQKLDTFLKSSYFKYPNGIAAGAHHNLYIATYNNGLMQLNTTTGELQPLPGAKDSAIAHGLDGLVYWKNTLLGVYNSSDDRSTNTLVQYFLDNTGSKIVRDVIIDKGNPAFYEPTTAAVSGNILYLLANSHLAIYNKNKQSTTGIENDLLAAMILQYTLSKQ